MDRWRRGLALGLGVVFILAGLAETYRAVSSGDGGVVFWFGSLFGGGTLIITGTFALTRRTWVSFSLTAIGCLAAANATMWTLILPLLAATLLVLALVRALEVSRQRSSQLTPPS